MKKIFFLLIIVSLLSCTYHQILLKEKFKRPEFNHQHTYILRQLPFDFLTFFTVWKNFPVTYTELDSIDKIKRASDYTAYQKIQLFKNSFVIKDKIKNTKYQLIQDYSDNSSDLVKYKIKKKNSIIGIISQNSTDNFLDYTFMYNRKEYRFTGKINQVGNNVHSFDFTISNNGKILATVYKEYLYLVNRYEIIINRQYKDIEDPVYICMGVLTNQILKDNGYHYK